MTGTILSSQSLPLVDDPQDQSVRDQFNGFAGGSGILNLHRMMAHAPTLMKASGELALALRRDTTLPRSLAEIIILRIAQLFACDYVWHRHVTLARANGSTEVQLEALAHWSHSDAFTPREKAAIEFCEAAAQQLPVGPKLFATLRQHFSPREIVEMTIVAGSYVSTVIFVKALAVPAEKPPPKEPPGD